MNANDRIAMEIGGAALRAVIAETQVEGLNQQIAQRDAQIAAMQVEVEALRNRVALLEEGVEERE